MALPNRLPPSTPSEVHSSMSDKEICPRCQVEMIEREGYPGCYVCPRDSSHTKDAEPAPAQAEAAPRFHGAWGSEYRDFYICNVVSLKEAAEKFNAIPSHLKSCGIFGPLTPVVQAPNKGGKGGKGKGGSKSRSGRKKNKKGGKKFVNEPWGSEGGTNRK